MSHKITLAEAATYIDNLLAIADLENIAKNLNIGGTVSKNVFQTQSPMSGFSQGKMFWNCWDSAGSHSASKLFIAFEQFNQFSQTPLLKNPANATLQGPSDTFVYSGTNSSNFILNHDTGKSPGAIPISKALVTQYKNAFRTDFPFTGVTNPYNQTAFSFLDTSVSPNDFQDLVDQTGVEGIRYYFGYDSQVAINQIRIILVAVDANGKNILTGGSKDIILERISPPY